MSFYREEKSEQLAECREELEHTKLVLAKLRSDSQEWFNEARKAAAYRDEVDALREKAERCDRLITMISILFVIVFLLTRTTYYKRIIFEYFFFTD